MGVEPEYMLGIRGPCYFCGFVVIGAAIPAQYGRPSLGLMNTKGTTTVDFVAKGVTPDEWRVVLVEEGPWSRSVEAELRRVQERLYECIDAALDGQFAKKFPESNGAKIVIQLDCYNVPGAEVADFFDTFSKGVFFTNDYKDALVQCRFVKGISFEVNFDSIH